MDLVALVALVDLVLDVELIEFGLAAPLAFWGTLLSILDNRCWYLLC